MESSLTYADLLFASAGVAIIVAAYAIAGYVRSRIFPRVPRTPESESESEADAARRDRR